MGNLPRVFVVGIFAVLVAASANSTQQPASQPSSAGGWVHPLPPLDAGPTQQATSEPSRSQLLEPQVSEEELSALLSDNPESAEAAKPIGVFCANLWSHEMYTVCDSSRDRCNVRRRGAALLADYWSVGACEPVYQAHSGIPDDTSKDDVNSLRAEREARDGTAAEPIGAVDFDEEMGGCIRGCVCGRTCIECSKTCRAAEPARIPTRSYGPVCKRGCPCGNSCISCSKRCRK